MEIIKITDEIIDIIANAEFERQFKNLLTDKPLYIQYNWKDAALEMINNYNRVVEILNERI